MRNPYQNCRTGCRPRIFFIPHMSAQNFRHILLVFRHEHDVVLAVPKAMIQTVIIIW